MPLGAWLGAILLGGALLLLLRDASHAQVAAAGVNDLQINEFMAVNGGSVIDPADTEPGEGEDDWLEIYNGGSEPVDLLGLFVTDNLEDLTKHQITQSVTISPGGFLVLWADAEPAQGPTHLPFRLSGDGEDLALVASDGVTVIDSHTFGPQESDVAVGRLPDGGPTWVTIATSPTPGASNRVAPTISGVQHAPLLPAPGAPVTVTATISDDGDSTAAALFYRTTVGSSEVGSWFSETLSLDAGADEEVRHGQQYAAQLSGQPDNTLVEYYIEAVGNDGETVRYPDTAPTETRKYLVGYDGAPVRINELMADNGSTLEDPDELDEYPDWFELINIGDEAINLDGYYLTDDVSNPTRFVISGALALQPGAIVLFYADDDPSQGRNHTNFRLENAGETLAIFEPQGAAPVDLIEFGQQGGDRAYGRFPDGAGTWGEPLCATPGEPNILCDKQLYMPTTLNNASVTTPAGDEEQEVRE